MASRREQKEQMRREREERESRIREREEQESPVLGEIIERAIDRFIDSLEENRLFLEEGWEPLIHGMALHGCKLYAIEETVSDIGGAEELERWKAAHRENKRARL